MHASPERPPRPAEAGAVLTAAALVHLRGLAQFVAPQAPALQRNFLRDLARRGCDVSRRRELAGITPASASVVLSSGRPISRFLDVVQHHGRRLAKLNVPPCDAVDALRRADSLLDPVTGGHFRPAREQLHLATVLALNNAFYDVREAETQAFFGLSLVESEGCEIPDLLRRFANVIARALHARGASLSLPARGVAPARRVPRFLSDARRLGDERLHRLGRCGWSFPILVDGRPEGVIELVFEEQSRWLPREAELLRAAGERCGRAIERVRLLDQVVRLGAAARQAEEDERRRIGRELHDDTAQSLLALRLQLEMAERETGGTLARRLGDARERVERTIVDLRRVIAALSPASLERLGLEAALRHLCERHARRNGAVFGVRISPAARTVPGPLAETAYRVAQEALQNVSRHSRATHVNLSLQVADRTLKLRVADNGAGFDAESAVRRPMSFGLAGMRERAERSGGTLRIRSSPEKGTILQLDAPLPAGETKRNG